MDSVSQSTEDKKHGNDQSEQSEENGPSGAPRENSSAQQLPEQEQQQRQNHGQQNADSGQAPGTKCSPKSSSAAPPAEPQPPAAAAAPPPPPPPPPADQSNFSISSECSIPRPEKVPQSEAEMHQGPPPPPPAPPADEERSPGAGVPELTLVGKFEISPIKKSTEISNEGSLRLECGAARCGATAAVAVATVESIQNKSQNENEKSGTTTFEVNRFRDANLKIAADSLPLEETLSSTSSHCDGAAGGTATTTATTTTTATATVKTSTTTSSRSIISSCNRESSKIESMQPHQQPGRMLGDPQDAESSSHTGKSDSSKSMQPDSCARSDDGGGSVLENDFILDSKKLGESSMSSASSSSSSSSSGGEREAKSIQIAMNPSSSCSSAGGGPPGDEGRKGTVSALCNYSSSRILNARDSGERHEHENSLERQPEAAGDSSRKGCGIAAESASSSSSSSAASTGGRNLTIGAPNAPIVSSLMEQSEHVSRGMGTADSAKFQTDKDIKSAAVRDRYTSAGGSSNLDDNVVSSSNNSSSFPEERNSSGREVSNAPKDMVSRTVMVQDTKCLPSIPKSEAQREVNQAQMKVQTSSNFGQSQTATSSFQSCQPTTKEIVASKIRDFYDNKSAVYNLFGGSRTETGAKSTHYSDYSNYYNNSSKDNNSLRYGTNQFQNPGHINENINSSSVDSSKLQNIEQRQPDNSKTQQYNEKLSYSQSSSDKLNTVTATQWRTTENQYPKSKYGFKNSAEDLTNLHSSTNSNNSSISTVGSVHPAPITSEQIHHQEAQAKNSSAIRSNSSQGQINILPFEKESAAIKRGSMTLTEKIQQRIESQVRGTSSINQNQLQETDYQKYLAMNVHDKEREYQRQVIYNQKSLVEATEAMNRSLLVQKHADLARQQEQIQTSMGLMNRPSPVQNYMDSTMRPSPVQNHTEAMCRPSTIQNHTDVMRRPSPIQSHGEAMRRPSPIQQNHMEAMRRPSPVQNHTEVLRRPSPVQMIQNAQNHSLYVNNPDFSKQMQPKQRTNANSNNDLSQLHMKPPDFSKVSPAQQQQRQNPQNQMNKIKDGYKQNVPPQITQQNFAEISKKFNYISDLQLKNPPTGEDRNVSSAQAKSPYNNLYVKAPDFSTEKFHNKSSLEANQSFEQHHQIQQQQAAHMVPKPLTTYNALQMNEASYARQFPQLSHDVELSVVSQKNSSFHTEKTPNSCEFQNQGKHAPFAQEQVNKLQDRVSRPTVLNEQCQRGGQTPYQSRVAASDYPAPYSNSVHVQSREQYQQINSARSSYLPETKPAVRPSELPVQPQSGYEAARYDPKIQQNTFAQSYPREAYPNPSYNYPQGSASVIQSSKGKDCYPEYPSAASNLPKSGAEYSAITTGIRQMPTSNYYSAAQQATPPTTPSSINSIPSPSQVGSTKSYPNQMPQQNISNPPSPACHQQQQGPYKTTPSPGAMNPPYGWPSQSTTRGGVPMGSSPSPHNYRVSQSPLGTNAPSPHSQSPSYMQPSPKASPSPTYQMSRPSPQAPTSVHMNYKPPYSPAAQNIPTYYQQIDPSKQAATTSYPMKVEKVNPEPHLSQYKPPMEVKQDFDQYRQMEQRKDFPPNDYTAAQYTQKSATAKRMEFPEYQPQAPRKNEPIKNSYKYSMQAAETIPRTEYPSTLGKSSSELALNKSIQKPNYREMINHAYAIRNSISEKELNAEIIKRTLKMDIMRRSDSDLSKNIFDSPDPTKNCGYFARSTDCMNTLRPQQPDLTPKYPPFDPGRRPSFPETSKPSRPFEYQERKTSLPLCNELANNGISVTVSKVVKPPAPEKVKPLERSAQSLHPSYPGNSDFSSVVISKVNPGLEHPAPSKNQRPKEMPKVQQPLETNKPTTSVFASVKRESPLDLSVKTVKTKADSTGCDDVNSYLSRTNASTSSALKVDFAPNFSKIGDNGVRTNAQQPPPGCYEPRHASTAISAQVSRPCPQPSQSSKPNAVSQSRPNQHPAQSGSSAAALGTVQHHSQAQHHLQYSSPHHYPPPTQQHIQATTHNHVMPNYQNTRPENVYPVHQTNPREVLSYHYPQGQGQGQGQGVHSEQKVNPHIVTPEQQQQQIPQQQQYAPTTHQQKQIYDQGKECQKPRTSLFQPMPGTSSYPLNSKDPNLHGYMPPKRDPESVKQSVILNPPMPSTVYDKRSDDYLVNTPQHQRKITEKAKEPEVPKTARPSELPPHLQQQKYPNIHPTQGGNLRYGQPYGAITSRPEEKPSVLHNHITQQQHPGAVVQKEYPGAFPQYDRSKLDTKARVQEEYVKSAEEPRAANMPARNMTHDPYSQYASTAPALDPHKAAAEYKARVNNKTNVGLEQGDSMHDRFRPSEYHRKRPPEPTSGKGYQPPDKQVRVDELYRAHLEETYRQQQKQQQLQQTNSQTHGGQQFERRDMSVIQPTADIANKLESNMHCATMQTHRPPGQYNYPYKDGYQIYGPPNREPVPSQVPPSNYHQTQQIWYPQVQSREKALQEASDMSKREAHPFHPQYNIPAAHPNDLESNRGHVEAKRPSPTSTEIGTKPTSTAAPSGSSNSNTTSVLRGADQNVLSKLRNSIEMREFEKQRTSLLKKQISLIETGEEDASKPDIASILAARIRTKGELKGYTPAPPIPFLKAKELEKEPPPESKEPLVPVPDPFSEGEDEKRLDLLDWSSACNDFVEQLLTGNSKKRGKKKRNPKGTTSENNTEKSEDVDKESKGFPGKDYNCDMDKVLVEQMKTEAKDNAAAMTAKKEAQRIRDSTSSDEDKPLLHLKQQKGSDASVSASIDSELKKTTPDKGPVEVKSQDSESTMQSSRTSVVDKLNEKVARNLREKQRMEQERRLAARLSRTSSSDSEDDGKRNTPRQKRPRKPRSRTSGASNRELSETDSSGAEDKIMSQNLIRSRIESKKRRRVQNTSSESDTTESEQKTPGKDSKIRDGKNKTPAKKEMITKARVKCMKLSSESSDSSDDNSLKPRLKKSTKDETSKATRKDDSEDESAADRSKLRSSSPCKPRNKRTVSTRQSIEESGLKETMTRSKRKKELEKQIANSKILRNEKIVQNIQPLDRKGKGNEKTSTKSGKMTENWCQEEKGKPSQNKGKGDKAEDLKRKYCGHESDEKGRKKRISKDESTSSSSDSSKESEEETVSDRVRTRRSRLSNEKLEPEPTTKLKKSKLKEKTKDEVPKNSAAKPGLSKKSSGKNKCVEQAETNTEKFPPGWELEVYQYKRALKVPASLISIKGPVHHRVSTSLPDLDPHSSDASESFSTENSRQGNFKSTQEDTKTQSQSKNSKKSTKLKKDTEPEPEPIVELKKGDEHIPKSIIDVLHSRVLKSKKLNKKNAKNAQGSEPKFLPRGSNEAELLPTPASVKDNKNPFANEHHNLFETEVLKSRTRTEYRILKNKELIREVFGGEDRPASAPPEIRDDDTLNGVEIKTEQVTFDQKYQQYLQKMNVDFGEKIRKNKKLPGTEGIAECGGIVIKTERIDEEETSIILTNADEETQDMEINECFQTPLAIKEEVLDINERDTPSIASEREGVVTPLIFKRRKGGKNRSGRRKGSSGFDYIRKKKKVSSNANASQDVIKKRRTSPIELFHSRDENDVSKEIQKWVLNKSVGQSALHKAARLGYLDVIAYCLERIGMHPDPKDNAGYTPLHEACAKGRIDIARILLQYGANHSETAHSGIRPLHEASENGYIEVVRLLLSYGADPLLTTYSGQTPLKLAESQEMENFLKNHLQDVQNTGPHKQPWKFPGPWKIYDHEEYGYDVLSGAPEVYEECEEDTTSIIKEEVCIQKIKEKCDTNSNIMISEDKIKKPSPLELEAAAFKTKLKSVSKCTVVLDNIDSLDHINSVKQFNDCHGKLISRRRSTFEKRELRTGRMPDESDCDGETFEFEESDMPLPPLYLLKDEGTEKWVLLNDLCNMLKVKSKDTLLKQICPSIPPSTVNKELLRELKMSDFLEKATCLQLLCAGEKLNISSSKVVLVKYNESVRNLLGVKTILMKF